MKLAAGINPLLAIRAGPVFNERSDQAQERLMLWAEIGVAQERSNPYAGDVLPRRRDMLNKCMSEIGMARNIPAVPLGAGIELSLLKVHGCTCCEIASR